MGVVPTERLRGDLIRLMHRGAGVRDYSLGAARILARSVPFDGVCMLTMDPATLLPTNEVVENGLPGPAVARMAEIEMRGEDFNTWEALARSERHTASLSQATRGKLDRSKRHREIRGPHGFGDELRAALVGESGTWGALTLLRGGDHDHYSPADAEVVASVTRELAEGLRRAMLLRALSNGHVTPDEPTGLVLLAADNSIVLADAAAERWLAELGEGEPLPPAVTAVAGRARTIADGDAATSATARVRVCTASGQWLVVRGSTLGDDGDRHTAVILEPARPHELAPLVADAYGLTERERVVTELVARGLDTNAIAGRLHLSPWTVQDHLKSIFEKVGVGTRGELVARVFFAHYVPRLTDGAPVGTDGWFAPAGD